MKKLNITEDIKVFYVTAKSFPEGIKDATEKLHSLFPYTKERKIFGLSRPENNQGIVYKAAAEELYPGEAKKYDCDTLIIPKGEYISITVHDFRKNIMNIDKAFQELLNHPNLDPNGYCVEWYASEKEEVICMIRLDK